MISSTIYRPFTQCLFLCLSCMCAVSANAQTQTQCPDNAVAELQKVFLAVANNPMADLNAVGNIVLDVKERCRENPNAQTYALGLTQFLYQRTSKFGKNQNNIALLNAAMELVMNEGRSRTSSAAAGTIDEELQTFTEKLLEAFVIGNMISEANDGNHADIFINTSLDSCPYDGMRPALIRRELAGLTEVWRLGKARIYTKARLAALASVCTDYKSAIDFSVAKTAMIEAREEAFDAVDFNDPKFYSKYAREDALAAVSYALLLTQDWLSDPKSRGEPEESYAVMTDYQTRLLNWQKEQDSFFRCASTAKDYDERRARGCADLFSLEVE